MLKSLETISSVVKYSNPYWEYKFDEYKLPNGNIGEYHYVNSFGSTIVIPRNDNGNYILTRQYRYLNKKYSIEFPGGGLKRGVDPIENALNELKEETGYIAKEIFLIGDYNPFNGVTNEICKVYLATDLLKGSAKPDISEEFEILEINYKEIINKISKGEIWDGMTLSAWVLYYYSPQNFAEPKY